MKYPFGLATLLLAFASLSAQAESLADEMNKCSKVDNSLKRLVCYDKLNQRAQGYADSQLPSNLQAPARQYQPAEVANNDASLGRQHQASPESNFGIRAPIEDIDSLSASVAKVEKDRRGRMTITLDNGQEWKQTDDEYLGLKPGDSVVIEKGMLGSFLLRKSGSSKPIRVSRSS